MNFLSHVFKKDLMRLQGALIVWMILLCIQSSLGIGGVKFTMDNMMFQVLLPQLGWAIKFLQGLMVVILIPLLIQDDPLVGSTGFWLTRPIGRQQLLVTKAVFVVCILLFFPLVAEMIVFLANGVLPQHIVLAVPEILIENAAFMIPFIILATITPKFSRYALVGAIIFAACVMLWILVSVLIILVPWIGKLIGSRYFFNQDIYNNYTLGLSINVVKNIFIIVFGSAVVIDQYRTRNTRKTIRWIIVGFIALVLFNKYWTIDFLKPVSPSTKKSISADKIHIDIDPRHALVSDDFSYGKDQSREKVISAQVDISGLLPGQFAILTNIKPKMHWPKEVLRSVYITMGSRELLSHIKFMQPLQALLPDSKILNPYMNSMAYKEVFKISHELFNQYKNIPGTYQATVGLDVYKYQMSTTIPLKTGTRGIFGSQQVVIFDILQRDTGISVIVGEKRTNLLFDRREEKINPFEIIKFLDFSNVYIIENKKRKEAFLAEVSDASVFDYNELMNSQSRLFTRVKRLDFLFVNDRNGPLPKIDQEWLKDAQLLRMDVILMGKAKKTLKIEGFVLPEQSTDPMPKQDPFEDALKQQYKAIERDNSGNREDQE